MIMARYCPSLTWGVTQIARSEHDPGSFSLWRVIRVCDLKRRSVMGAPRFVWTSVYLRLTAHSRLLLAQDVECLWHAVLEPIKQPRMPYEFAVDSAIWQCRTPWVADCIDHPKCCKSRHDSTPQPTLPQSPFSQSIHIIF